LGCCRNAGRWHLARRLRGGGGGAAQEGRKESAIVTWGAVTGAAVGAQVMVKT